MAVPTLPAPAMATFTSPPSPGCPVRGQHVVELAQRVVEHGEVQHVALLAHQVPGVEPGHARRVTTTRLSSPGLLDVAEGRPAQFSGSERSTRVRRPLASDQSPTSSSGSRRRRTWSMVQVTVATVGMPSRW